MRASQEDTNAMSFYNRSSGILSDTDVTDKPTTYNLSTQVCIYVHATIMASLFVLGIARSVGFYAMCVRASQRLHNFMFHGLISATMRFFDTNPSVSQKFLKNIYKLCLII